MKNIKIYIACIVLLVFGCWIGVTGCNKSIIDTKWNFNYAYIKMPTGDVVEGAVASWTDFEDGDQIQITMKNGKTYLTHISNVVLVSK